MQRINNSSPAFGTKLYIKDSNGVQQKFSIKRLNETFQRVVPAAAREKFTSDVVKFKKFIANDFNPKESATIQLKKDVIEFGAHGYNDRIRLNCIENIGQVLSTSYMHMMAD